MSITPNSRISEACAKWVLVVVLILNFFTFSGITFQTQTNPCKPQTTLTAASNLQRQKSINYKRALQPAQLKYLSLVCFVNADQLYTEQVIVRIKELGATVLLAKTVFFYKVKTIPQNAGDEPVCLIG